MFYSWALNYLRLFYPSQDTQGAKAVSGRTLSSLSASNLTFIHGYDLGLYLLEVVNYCCNRWWMYVEPLIKDTALVWKRTTPSMSLYIRAQTRLLLNMSVEVSVSLMMVHKQSH